MCTPRLFTAAHDRLYLNLGDDSLLEDIQRPGKFMFPTERGSESRPAISTVRAD